MIMGYYTTTLHRRQLCVQSEANKSVIHGWIDTETNTEVDLLDQQPQWGGRSKYVVQYPTLFRLNFSLEAISEKDNNIFDQFVLINLMSVI